MTDIFPNFFSHSLAQSDNEIAQAVAAELNRQQTEIELIASENIVSKAVMEAQGTVLTNKYAEGILVNAIMAVVSMLTWSKIWPSIAQSNCSAVTL